MKHKISVAMAVFEDERFIGQQLDSILCQSLLPDEIIICDDSRNDKTYKAIEKTIKRYSKIIKYFKNETRLGVSKNFEKAISLSGGDIIFLSDQDDVWQSEKIQSLASLIMNSLFPIGTFCNSTIVDENLNPSGSSNWDNRRFSADIFLHADKMEKLAIFAQIVPVAGHNMAFDAKLKDIILPFPDLPECHDTWIGLVIAAASEWFLIDVELTMFRQHQCNVSKVGKSNQLKQAIDSIKNNTFAWNVTLYDELIKRLINNSVSLQPQILALLKDRRNHSATRAKMNCNIFKRLPLVCKEIKNKRYFKYGRGWKNIIQDLVLRGNQPR